MSSLSDRNLKIALVNAVNEKKKYAINKDLNGGFGTADNLGDSLFLKLINLFRKQSTRLPVLSFAYVQAILKKQGYFVQYFERNLPEEEFDIILIYGSIVDYKNEISIVKILKEKFPKSKVGFFGTFPSRNAYLFDKADFVLTGEAEAFFLHDFKNVDQLKGEVFVTSLTDLNALPSPCFDGFPINDYSYEPIIYAKPFLTLQASKGCPYSCGFYCTYGEYQGSKIRIRDPKKVVEDIVYLQQRYNTKGVQFRDPVFGIDTDFVLRFCEELAKRHVDIVWGVETRLDLLNENIIKIMFDAGLHSINVGIETNNMNIAQRSKRKLVEHNHQEKMIKFCNKLGIKITAFYLLCLEEDTLETIKNTVRYAIKLNTPLARFAIATPYPGTGFYQKLENESRILTRDYENYTQFNLVYKHDNVSPLQAKKLLDHAYRKYYLRPQYLYKMVKRKLKMDS